MHQTLSEAIVAQWLPIFYQEHFSSENGTLYRQAGLSKIQKFTLHEKFFFEISPSIICILQYFSSQIRISKQFSNRRFQSTTVQAGSCTKTNAIQMGAKVNNLPSSDHNFNILAYSKGFEIIITWKYATPTILNNNCTMPTNLLPGAIQLRKWYHGEAVWTYKIYST